MIAASVVLAALNNLRGTIERRRWVLAFVFGLIHGFGFASVLADLGLPQDALVLALVGFNVGVELGPTGHRGGLPAAGIRLARHQVLPHGRAQRRLPPGRLDRALVVRPARVRSLTVIAGAGFIAGLTRMVELLGVEAWIPGQARDDSQSLRA